ncbi:HNH endonuclease [Actinomyces faecalis]|uniref:HNH endonuclease n=1 Tax=Actinomyces faecalis TaxID=2722820 RepID=UPI001557D2C9|nr:HNH endonuclease [Actinomyces faecalis]
MPVKPKTPCRAPGCPVLTHERFCPEHQRAEDERYRKYQRDPAINRRYDETWRRLRRRYLSVHPECEECLATGRVTPAAEVHHILPLSKGGSHDFTNLRALCKSCHSRQSAKDGDRWRQGAWVYSY